MIIGISGKIGSGKDTVAEILQSLEPSFQNKKYAGKLKQVAGLLLGVDPAKFEDREYKESTLGPEWGWETLGPNRETGRFDYTVRKFLQVLGTEAMRDNLHTDVWLNALFADYTEDQNWIITDVRFQNEADRIKEMGGLLIRINRDTGVDSGSHPSETALDDYNGFDIHIDNNGSIDNLESHIKTMWENFIYANGFYGALERKVILNLWTT